MDFSVRDVAVSIAFDQCQYLYSENAESSTLPVTYSNGRACSFSKASDFYWQQDISSTAFPRIVFIEREVYLMFS